MNLYYKRYWDETTGEELTDNWGTSIYYFETNEELSVIRQIQIFKHGAVLKYSVDFPLDEFGMLSDQQFDQIEFQKFAITETEFTTAWNNLERKSL